MRVLGFMTGTSLDAVDMAVVETDGEEVLQLGPAGEKKLSPDVRAVILEATAAALAWPAGEPEPAVFAEAAAAVAREHIAAAEDYMAQTDILPSDLDYIAVHGQTVLHEPPRPGRPVGRTVQLVDAPAVASALGVPVIYDFRSADVAAGGQGAPLAPVYHAAMVRWSSLHTPTAVLNLGGVANVTLVKSDGTLEAFDTGPANGMVDLWMQEMTMARYDHNGLNAKAGKVRQDILAAYLDHPYFAAAGPKSLDRYEFSLDPVRGLSIEDGAATLTAFAAEAVARGVKAASEIPLRLVIAGGGRNNATLVGMIKDRLPVNVILAEEAFWRGDSLEAEAVAYLAARTAMGLPISYPGTTGVPEPMAGGRIALP
jgi:anhydro-N-acetylmuramic acid kinase